MSNVFYPCFMLSVNGKIKCRKMAKKNVVFPTFFVSPNS